MGSSPWATAPAKNLLQQGFFTGCSPLQVRSTCSIMGSSMGCSLEIYSTVGHHGLQGDSLLHQASPQATGELLLRAWSSPCPPSALTLLPAGPCCLQDRFSFFSLPDAVVQHFFSPFLKSALTEAQTTSCFGLALSSSGSLLDPSETGPYLTWGSF